MDSPNSSQSQMSDKFRGATVEDLDPPPALSVSPDTPLSAALTSAFERDYTHLTVVHPRTRSLLGYLSIPRIKTLIRERKVSPENGDTVEKAMQKFVRKGRVYEVITMETPLEELEQFFARGVVGGDNAAGRGNGSGAQDFAVVTDEARRFVLGVATRNDLEEFARRRP